MPSERRSFINDPVWPDTAGQHINVHGGGVMYHEGTYYWYGEYRNPRGRGRPRTQGVGCYSSTDLYNWKNEGVVLSVVENDPTHEITAGATIERPKVIYNAKTGKFVLWFHLEHKGRGYDTARTALAVADKPTGPFEFKHSIRPNAGKWPIDMPKEKQTPLTQDQVDEALQRHPRRAITGGVYTRRDFSGGQMSRDMTLFVDDDGKAYHIASAEENYTMNIHELTDDFLDFTGKWTRVLPGGHNEAPAVVKHEGKYYILASGATGWAPNEARYLVADSIWGPWKLAGNPCVGTNPDNNLGPEKTFGGQSTYILKVHDKPGAYIAMFDIWHPRKLNESGHIWLPIAFKDGKMILHWRDQWDLSVFDQ